MISCILLFWVGFLSVAAKDSSCEVFAENRLSAWQIVKKALWDRVRGASLEISMQEGALMQLSLEVEGISGADEDCPLGILAIQLFLLDMHRALPKSSQPNEVAAWIERLLNNVVFFTQWSDIVRSGWPIFGLLARLSQLSQPFQLDRNLWQGIAGIAAPELANADEIQSQLQDAIRSELAELGHSSFVLLKNFFDPASKVLWTQLSFQMQDYIFRKAAMKDGQLDGAAYYFLSHLRAEFSGFSGPVDPFLRNILELTNGSSSCWDVGAAPVPNDKDERFKEQDVWQICRHYGLDTHAFEPSEMGFQRLFTSSESIQSISESHGLRIHRLALSNASGEAYFNRGGQVTGSLGTRGCGLFAFNAQHVAKASRS
eukprot:Skav226544  [mRNA]  locus=scaffold421:98769:99884:+ [translate_table: standard]